LNYILWYAGALGLLWAVMWFFTTYDSPAAHPRISDDEKEYIQKALASKSKKVCKASSALNFLS